MLSRQGAGVDRLSIPQLNPVKEAPAAGSTEVAAAAAALPAQFQGGVTISEVRGPCVAGEEGREGGRKGGEASQGQR